MNALLTLLKRASMELAVVGDGDGAHEVADRPNYVHARLGGVGGRKAEVHTSAIRPNYGDYIYVMLEDPANPNSWRMAFWLRDGGEPARDPPIRGTRHELCLVVTGEGFVVNSEGKFVRAHCS